MRFFKSKKIMVMVGIAIIIIVCLVIDFIISNFTNDQVWTGESDIGTDTNNYMVGNETLKGGTNENNNSSSTESELIDSFSQELNILTDSDKSKEGKNGEKNDILESNNEDNIYVYITGEVNKQGVVILKNGSRIDDAIKAAGGVTSNANISKINLVFILEDGMKINIPSYNDLKNNPDFEYITRGSGDGENDSWTSTSSNNNSNSSINSNDSYSAQIQVVNINTASQTELETLPGIGPSLALRIINYREENGKFSNIDEIKNVSGIGDGRFNDIKNYITV